MHKNTITERILKDFPIAVAFISYDTNKIIYSNTAFNEHFVPDGINPIGKTTIDLKIWKDLKKRDEIVEKLTRRHSVYNVETILINKNEEERSYLVNFIMEDEEKMLVETFVDVTEIGKTKNQYEKLLCKYQSLINITNTAFIILDDNLIIQEANNIAGEMLGCTAIELIGERLHRILCDKEQPRKEETLLTFSKVLDSNSEQKSINLEICLRRKDGTKKWVFVNAGSFGYNKIVCFMNDISQKKKMEHSNFIKSEKSKDNIKQKLNQFKRDITKIKGNY